MMPSEQHTEPTRYLAAACSFAVHRGLYYLAASTSYIGMISEAMKEGSLWTNEPIEDFMVLSSCGGFVSVGSMVFADFCGTFVATPFVWGPWWVAICRRKSPPWPGGKKDPGSEPLPETRFGEGNYIPCPHDRMRFFFDKDHPKSSKIQKIVFRKSTRLPGIENLYLRSLACWLRRSWRLSLRFCPGAQVKSAKASLAEELSTSSNFLQKIVFFASLLY